MTIPRIIIASAVAAALFTAPALAGSAVDTETIAVDITGYNLATDDGAKIVLSKIEDAAERACDARVSVPSIKLRRLANVCVAEAVNNAVNAISAPVLKQAYIVREASRAG